jgi:hypothetical protein
MGLVAIDPGNVTGFALFWFNSGFMSLAECGITKERYMPARTQGVSRYRVAIERPQADGREGANGKPIPLTAKMTLAWNAGKLAGWYEAFGYDVAEIEPRAWKASLSKDQCWEQVRRKLTDAERATVHDAATRIAPSYLHNMYDAIGIGMAVLGRFKVRP